MKFNLIRWIFTYISLYIGEEGDIECTFCEKKFFVPSQLTKHIRKHTGKEIYYVLSKQG